MEDVIDCALSEYPDDVTVIKEILIPRAEKGTRSTPFNLDLVNDEQRPRVASLLKNLGFQPKATDGTGFKAPLKRDVRAVIDAIGSAMAQHSENLSSQSSNIDNNASRSSTVYSGPSTPRQRVDTEAELLGCFDSLSMNSPKPSTQSNRAPASGFSTPVKQRIVQQLCPKPSPLKLSSVTSGQWVQERMCGTQVDLTITLFPSKELLYVVYDNACRSRIRIPFAAIESLYRGVGGSIVFTFHENLPSVVFEEKGLSARGKYTPCEDFTSGELSRSRVLSVQFSSPRKCFEQWEGLASHPGLQQAIENSIHCKYNISFNQEGSGAGNLVGVGSFGRICRGTRKLDGKPVAVKCIDKSGLSSYWLERVRSEHEVHSKLEHEHIVKILEVIDSTHQVYIIMDLATGGDLFDYLDKYKFGVPEAQACVVLTQLLQALSYCHSQQVIHRDIKLENILLRDADSLHTLLCDFGIAKAVDSPQSRAQTNIGTEIYSAPEVLFANGTTEYDNRCDIWSAGVVAYYLLCGEHPFRGDQPDPANPGACIPIIKQVTTMPPRFSEHGWTRVSPEARAFVEAMLVRDAPSRPSAASLLAHPWVEGGRGEEVPRFGEDGDSGERTFGDGYIPSQCCVS